jgi:hypothetical protein
MRFLSTTDLVSASLSITAGLSLNAAETKPAGHDVGFEKIAEPFIEFYCADCHDDAKPKADLDLTALTPAMDTEESVFHWQKMLEQVQAGVMPPVDKDQPTAEERKELISWLEAKVVASEFGGPYRKKLLLPQYGNYVDHEKLFSGEITTAPYSPSRLWRLSPYLFASKGSVNKSVKGLQNPYSFSTPKSGVRDYSFSSDVGASTVETLLLNANAELEWQFASVAAAIDTADGKPVHRNSTAYVPFLTDHPEFTTEELEAPIAATFRRVVSRMPTQAELDRYVTFLKANIAETGDPSGSLRTTLKAIYMSPETIYRMEWGLGPEDEHGRRVLSSNELAYALSYALFDSGPSGEGRSKAALIATAEGDGKLSTKEDVAAVVQAILADESYSPIGGQSRNAVPRIMRFFEEFFGYNQAGDVFKDGQWMRENGLYHNPRTLVKDADNLIKAILREDKNVFEELLTTNRAVIFHNGVNQHVIDNYNRTIADLKTWDEERVAEDIKRRKAGTRKKPKYKNNPKLLVSSDAKMDTIGKNLLEAKKKELARLLKSGPVMPSVKGRELGYLKAYNIEFKNWKWPLEQPFELPREERAGILTHPAWLVAHSLNDETDPVRRGIWVYEKLLAGVIADLPPDVDAQVPKDKHQSLRERFDVVHAKRCWACHQKMNPIGDTFEMFDDFGRVRQQFYFNEEGMIEPRRSITVKDEEGKEAQKSFKREEMVAKGLWTTRSVDATGSFDTLGVPELSGDVGNAIEMIHKIAKTDRARQSIIRHLFRYFMGRNELLSDSQTLIEADRAYLDSGGSFKALVVSLLSSDSFLYRR